MKGKRETIAVGVLLVVATGGMAGSLDSLAAPGDAASAMYELEDVYNRLDSGTPGTKRDGAFTEPSAPPGNSGHTVDEIMGKAPATNANAAVAGDVADGKVFWGLRSDTWGQQTGTASISANAASVPKTGQTISYAAGDDGDLEPGVSWPSPRFTDNDNGTVTDNLTQLIWLKDADAGDGTTTWAAALTLCNTLEEGQQGLTDGSAPGDWRLPTVKELHSLIDYSRSYPALPSGHPFQSVQSAGYWTSTSLGLNTSYAWYIVLDAGLTTQAGKTGANRVWPVRGGG